MTDDATERSDKAGTERSDKAGTERSDKAGIEHSDDDTDTQVDDALGALSEIKQRLAEVPPEVVIVNHAMGLYELAAIHLGASPPRLPEAALAIDAVGCLVEGLGDRLGPDTPTLRDALQNIRFAFVQLKNASTPS